MNSDSTERMGCQRRKIKENTDSALHGEAGYYSKLNYNLYSSPEHLALFQRLISAVC